MNKRPHSQKTKKISILISFFLILIIIILILLSIRGCSTESSAIYAPLAIGLGLTLIHLVTIPVTNTSVNPARSLGPALFVGGAAIQQVWLFWVAPILGAIVAGVLHKKCSCD